MTKPTKDPIREDRILQEAIVDAYGSEEKAMSWYYYLDSKLTFPFQACCIGSQATSPRRKGESAIPKVPAPLQPICRVRAMSRQDSSG